MNIIMTWYCLSTLFTQLYDTETMHTFKIIILFTLTNLLYKNKLTIFIYLFE